MKKHVCIKYKFILKWILFYIFVFSSYCTKVSFDPSILHVEYLVDNSHEKTIESVSFAKNFIPVKNNLVAEGYTSAALWLKLTYDSSRFTEPSYLVLNETYHDYLDYYQRNGSSWNMIQVGDLRSYHNRIYQHRGFVFALKHNQGLQTEYLKISSEDSINFSFSILNEVEIRDNEMMMGLLYGFFIGALTAMILYNLFIFVSLRDISYLYYSLLQLTFLLTNLYMMGYLNKYIWPDQPYFNRYYIPLFYGAFVYFSNQFVRSFLDLKRYAPGLDRVFLIFALAGVLISLSFYFISYRTSVFLISSVISVNSPLALFAGIFAWLRGKKGAFYYNIAWSVFLASGFAAVVGSLGVIRNPLLVSHLPQIGGLFEALFFTVALSYRYRIMEQSKKELQHEIFAIQKGYTQNLAREVEEKTKVLNRSVEAMNNDLRLARNIQQNVLLKKEHHFTFLQIASLYNPHSEVSGDFYDIAEIKPGVVRFFIADVTGHGLQAALVTMTLKSEYDFFKSRELAPDQLLTELNKSFIEKVKGTNIFATAFILDMHYEKNLVEYSSAGHPHQMLLVSADHEKVNILTTRGLPLGVLEKSRYLSGRQSIKNGARAYLYTDGITEAHNEQLQEFGSERFLEEILKTKEKPVESQLKTIHEIISLFSGKSPVADDQTFIIAQFNP